MNTPYYIIYFTNLIIIIIKMLLSEEFNKHFKLYFGSYIKAILI